MRTIVLIVMIVAGIIFAGSVMLMSPKGGLGVAIGGGAGGSNEYGSKKSLENTLKRAATVSLILFLVTVVALPYIS